MLLKRLKYIKAVPEFQLGDKALNHYATLVNFNEL